MLLIGGGGAMNPRTPHYYSRRRKRGNSTSIDSLSDDLLFEILVRLPAEDIHENVRIVCRRWKSIIRNDGFVTANLRHTCSGLLIAWEHGDGFASAHFHRTCSGLLIAKISEEISPPTSLAAEESRTQMLRLRYQLSFPVLAGCNGLILGAEPNERNRRFVANPVTKRRFDLPGLAIGLLCSRKHFALACGVSTGEYKVVATWCEAASGSPTVARCAILTLGVDKAWRHVPIGRFHCLARWLFFQAPKVTNGFIHWAGKSEVLSMNVETEVITHTTSPLLPHDYRSMSCHCWYLSAGKYLTLLISRGDRLLIEICEMEPKTGKWRKLVNKINLRPHKRMLEATLGVHMVFVPIGWVKYPDVLAIHGISRDAACIIYNLDTDVLAFLDTSGVYKTDVAHRNSLEWFD